MCDDRLDGEIITCAYYNWTAEQACTVVSFLELIAGVVRYRHDDGIKEYLDPTPICWEDPRQLKLPFHSSSWCDEDDDFF